ncbi:MAG: hypothetical protein U0527_14705 [Candidatus Eisenbacteria bacterium]
MRAATTQRATKAKKSVEQRVEAVASSLQQSLNLVAQSVVGPTLRTTRLAERLDLDKSLSSRLVRALKAESSLELVHFIPSPTGLGMFLHAAEEKGAPVAQCREARHSVEQFRALLEELPGGRAALDTWISRGASDVRQRAERTARQAVYRGMSHLLGFHCDSVSSALILQPAKDGRRVDGIEVSQRVKVRRVRPDTPVALFSIDLGPRREAGPAPRLEPLVKGSDPRDPASYILPRFSDAGAPALDIVQQGTHHVFALSDNLASVHQPVTVTSAMMVRNGWLRQAEGEHLHDGRDYLLHYPCKLVVRDLYLRDDVYLGVEPELRWEFPTPGASASGHASGLPARLNSLDVWSPIEHLGVGSSRWAVTDLKDHARLVAHAFATAGWDATRFRGYRARVIYPVPMILMGWRIPLPSASATATGGRRRTRA